MKRIMCLLLSVALLLAAVACGGEEPAQEFPEASLVRSRFAYQAAFTALQTEETVFETVESVCFSDERLYFTAPQETGSRIVETETGYGQRQTGQISLFCLDEETQLATLLVSGGKNGALDVLAMTPGEDGTVWVYQRSYSCQDESTGEAHTPQLCRYDTSGALLESMELPDVVMDNVYQMLRTEDGYVCLSDGTKLFVVNSAGTLLHTLVLEEFHEICLWNGQLGGVFEDEAGRCLVRTFDPVAAEFSSGDAVEEGISRIRSGSAEYAYIYALSGDAVYGSRAEGGESERLLTWSDFGVLSPQVVEYAILENGDVRGVISDGTGAEAVRLTRVDPSELEEKTQLTMACFNGMAADILPLVMEFNRSQSDIQISIVDYMDYGINGDQLLNTEIMAGNVPDLFYMDSLLLSRYAQNDVLRDMWPMIDGDEELDRDSLMTHVFETISKEGELNGISATFHIKTMVVPADRLSAQSIWTISDVQQIRDQLDAPYIFSGYDSRNGMIYRLIGYNSIDYLNWETGECYFDTPEFVETLKFIAEFPETPTVDYTWRDYEVTAVNKGEQVCAEKDLMMANDFVQCLREYGDDVNFVGFPSQNGGPLFRMLGCLGISEACEAPEAAWIFARQLLTEQYQHQHSKDGIAGFPTNANYFTTKATKEGLKGDKMTRFMEVYESCNRSMSAEETVLSIVQDEAAYFFYGEKTAEEVAAMIQDRVSLYMAERKIS